MFVAIPVPEIIKDSLQDVQRELQRLLPETAIRWTPREQIHLTLRFFGNVGSERLEELGPILHSICNEAAAFRLQGCGLGVFPERRFSRVIWAGVQDDKSELAALQGKIETATAAFGEKPEKKSFSAHLTLGRVKEIRSLDAAALHRFMETQTAGVCGQWPVNELELIRSELGNAGAKHSLISRHSLGRG